MGENLNARSGAFESPKDPQPIDALDEVKPDPHSNVGKASNFERPVYEQLDFYESIDKSDKSPPEEEKALWIYEQLKLPYGKIILIEAVEIYDLIQRLTNGRPSQKAEARYRLSQILEQNENHVLKNEINAVLGDGQRPVDTHVLKTNHQIIVESESTFTTLGILYNELKKIKITGKSNAANAIEQIRQFYENHEDQFNEARILLGKCVKKFTNGAILVKDKSISFINGILGKIGTATYNVFRIFLYLTLRERATRNFAS